MINIICYTSIVDLKLSSDFTNALYRGNVANCHLSDLNVNEIIYNSFFETLCIDMPPKIKYKIFLNDINITTIGFQLKL